MAEQLLLADLPVQDYKEALHAAMLYVQSVVRDVNHKGAIPSQRSIDLLKALTSNHSKTIAATAAELNKA